MLNLKFFFSSIFFLTLVFHSSLAQASEGRDKALFKLCTACHGDDGEGKIALEAPAIAGLSDWYIERQLMNFKNGARGKHPKDLAGLRMRPMARTIQTDADVKLVSAYVSKLPVQKKAHTVKGSVVAGEEAYKACAACHGSKGEGNKMLNAPSLSISNDWYLLKQLKNFKHGIRGGDASKDPNGATMKGMAAILDDKATEDVVVYIQTMK